MLDRYTQILALAIMVIFYLLLESALCGVNESRLTLLANKDSGNVDFERRIPVSPNIPAEGLYIISAQYGTDDRWRDVSKQLREKIHNNAISI